MMGCDLHVHTTFSDGANTPEEVICAAVSGGMKCIGVSDHSYTDFDESYCMSKLSAEKYHGEISALKKKYADKIRVLCGIEQDCFSGVPKDSYDYVIGSVHYIKIDDEYVAVDESAEILLNAAKKYFGSDMYSLIEEYYRLVAKVVEKTNADIIGHFDLITKFNQNANLFSESNPRYTASWKRAADRLLLTGKPFEINTGAISRGYRKTPYPSKEIIDYIKAKGGKFILSSDSHNHETLCFCFDKYEHLIK